MVCQKLISGLERSLSGSDRLANMQLTTFQAAKYLVSAFSLTALMFADDSSDWNMGYFSYIGILNLRYQDLICDKIQA